MSIINYLRLSRTDSDELSVVTAKQGDNLGDVCQIEVYDNQTIVELSDYDDIMFYANKPDKSSILFRLSDGNNNFVRNDNTLNITLTDTLLAVHGTVECEISFYKGAEIKSTYNFNIYVFKSPGSYDNLNVSDLGTLKNAVIKVDETITTITDLANKAKQSEINAANSATSANNSVSEALSSANIASQKARDASDSANSALSYSNTATQKASDASNSASSALSSANIATQKANEASNSASSAADSATNSQDYSNQSKGYSEQSKEYADSWKGSLLPQGAIPFSSIPTSGMIKGYMYCIINSFETDSRFEEGVGFFYPAGTCIYWTENNQWKCLSGVLSRNITQAEYDALSYEEKMNGTIYWIEDGDNSMKVATHTANGLMSFNDKIILDDISNTISDAITESDNTIVTNNDIDELFA